MASLKLSSLRQGARLDQRRPFQSVVELGNDPAFYSAENGTNIPALLDLSGFKHVLQTAPGTTPVHERATEKEYQLTNTAFISKQVERRLLRVL